MNRFVRTTIIVFIVFVNILYVRGQWCVGGSTSQNATATTSATGEITSINYPSPYTNYAYCTSYISTSGSDQVLFYVEDDDLEFRFDHLKIYSDYVVSSNRLFGSDYQSAPYVDVTSGDSLVATFTSDGSIRYGGFKMSYMAVDRASLPSCGSSITATSSSQQLSYVYRSSQSSYCSWTITPSDTTGTYAVQIDIIMVQGYVKISESGGDYYYSTQNSVYVSGPYPSSVQVTGINGNDFVVEYKQVVSTVTGVVQTSTVAVDNSICDNSYRTSTSSIQYVNSPYYPGEYQNVLDCIVVLEAEHSNQSVTVNITDYAVSTDDGLDIYDGSDFSFNRISGGDISVGSSFTSSGQSLALHFTTNYVGTNRGFLLSYYSVDRETPTCDLNFTLEGNLTSSNSEQTIQSPNYPNAYNNDDDRFWLIVKPSESNNIVLDFKKFKVEFANDCIYDYVSIYDGACTSDPLLAKVCGYEPVTFEDSTGLYILIHFHTDYSVTVEGWELTHYIGQFKDPDADEAAEDSGGVGIKDFVYPVIGIVVIIIVATVVFICIYCKGKGRVSDGVAKGPSKKRTTHDLFSEIRNKYVLAQAIKKFKIKRKGNTYHPKPNPPGPNTTIIDVGDLNPHPPPGSTDPGYPPDVLNSGTDIPGQTPPGSTDLEHPPDVLDTGTEMPGQNIAPVLTQFPKSDPIDPFQDSTDLSTVPPPFPYKTPAEARAEGTYGQPN